MLLNTQSIKNKEDLLTYYIRNEAIDMTIATETWLTNHDREVIWMESNGFVKDEYQISAINRVGKKGGELALIHRSNINVTKMDHSYIIMLAYHTSRITAQKLFHLIQSIAF